MARVHVSTGEGEEGNPTPLAFMCVSSLAVVLTLLFSLFVVVDRGFKSISNEKRGVQIFCVTGLDSNQTKNGSVSGHPPLAVLNCFFCC